MQWPPICRSASQEGVSGANEGNVQYNLGWVPASKFEQVVKAALCDLGKNPAILQECVRQANQEAGASLEPLYEQRDAHEEQLARVTGEIKRLSDVFKTQDNAPEDLKRECLELDCKKQHLKTQIELNRRRRAGLKGDSLLGLRWGVAPYPKEPQDTLGHQHLQPRSRN